MLIDKHKNVDPCMQASATSGKLEPLFCSEPAPSRVVYQSILGCKYSYNRIVLLDPLGIQHGPQGIGFVRLPLMPSDHLGPGARREFDCPITTSASPSSILSPSFAFAGPQSITPGHRRPFARRPKLLGQAAPDQIWALTP